MKISKALLENVDYYLDLALVDLHHGRYDGLRDYGDHVAAISHGYKRDATISRGRWGLFKRSCYATINAYREMQREEKVVDLHMEHVVPLKEVGMLFLQKFDARTATKPAILRFLNFWILPCVVTADENRLFLAARLSQSMPKCWNGNSPNPDLWARYKEVGLYPRVKRVRKDLPWISGPSKVHP